MSEFQRNWSQVHVLLISGKDQLPHKAFAGRVLIKNVHINAEAGFRIVTILTLRLKYNYNVPSLFIPFGKCGKHWQSYQVSKAKRII